MIVEQIILVMVAGKIIHELQKEELAKSSLRKLVTDLDYWKKFRENNSTEQLSKDEKKEIFNALLTHVKQDASYDIYDVALLAREENWDTDNKGFVTIDYGNNKRKRIFHKNVLSHEERNLLEQYLPKYWWNEWAKQEAIEELRKKDVIDCLQLKNVNLYKLSKKSKEKITQAILKNIRKNMKGWKIGWINKRGGLWSDDPPTKEDIIAVLIHDSAEIKYNIQGFLINDHSKVIEKDQFTEQQWSQLERILPQYQRQLE